MYCFWACRSSDIAFRVYKGVGFGVHNLGLRV